MTEPTAAEPSAADATAAKPTSAAADMADLMAARYGVVSRGRRLLTIGVVAAVSAALLTWWLWSAWHQATTTVNGSVSAFDVVAPHRVDVTVEIHRPANEAARCTVQAQATDHSVVGQTVLSLSPSGDSTVRVHTRIRTDREATTAVVSQCR